jgi:hypothetical protein
MTKPAAEAKAVKLYLVSVPAAANHPLLPLKIALDWDAISKIVTRGMRAAGRNIDGVLRGRRMFAEPFLPLVVLILVLRLDLHRRPPGS